MSNNNNNNINAEDVEFCKVFWGIGEHSSSMKNVTTSCREYINRIRNNTDKVEVFQLDTSDAQKFSNQAWELLGRYIANNTHLIKIDLCHRNLTDQKMALLFSGLRRSDSLQRLDLGRNGFGLDVVRSMIPFLEASPQLLCLNLSNNNNFNSDCFEVLISSLDGKSMEELYFGSCNITDISALNVYNIPNLQRLSLSGNSIGREGFITLSNLLKREGSTLTNLLLRHTGIGDEGVEILANSLKDNTKLRELGLENNNNITVKGRRVLLKLLVDVSSIESTYNSNHSLTSCHLDGALHNEIKSLIKNVCGENRIGSFLGSHSQNVGRIKVIKYQLNSNERKDLCRVQKVEYSSIGNLFADIEPVLLPDILALISRNHGRSELYCALTHTAPDLLSYIDRKAMVQDALAKMEAQGAALKVEYERKMADINDKKADLSSRLALIDLGDIKQSAVEKGNEVAERRNKRQRS